MSREGGKGLTLHWLKRDCIGFGTQSGRERGQDVGEKISEGKMNGIHHVAKWGACYMSHKKFSGLKGNI